MWFATEEYHGTTRMDGFVGFDEIAIVFFRGDLVEVSIVQLHFVWLGFDYGWKWPLIISIVVFLWAQSELKLQGWARQRLSRLHIIAHDTHRKYLSLYFILHLCVNEKLIATVQYSTYSDQPTAIKR